MASKNFFKKKTKTQMLKDEQREITDFIVEEILHAKPHETLIVKEDLTPQKYLKDNKFIKFAPTLNLRRFKSYQDAKGQNAQKLIEEALRENKKNILSGITYKPFAGPNNLTKKYTLTELLKATKLYTYAPWQIDEKPFKATTHIKPYDDAKRVSRDGAETIVRVPSREIRKPKYEMRFQSTPIHNNNYALNLAMTMTTTHMCKKKEFFIRYTYEFNKERSNIYLWDAHEISGYFGIIDYYANPQKRSSTDKKNLTPYKMNLFGVPTFELIKFYDNLEHNTLIKTKEDKKPRQLSTPEKEILLWRAVNHIGPKALAGQNKLTEYNWKQI